MHFGGVGSLAGWAFDFWPFCIFAVSCLWGRFSVAFLFAGVRVCGPLPRWLVGIVPLPCSACGPCGAFFLCVSWLCGVACAFALPCCSFALFARWVPLGCRFCSVLGGDASAALGLVLWACCLLLGVVRLVSACALRVISFGCVLVFVLGFWGLSVFSRFLVALVLCGFFYAALLVFLLPAR